MTTRTGPSEVPRVVAVCTLSTRWLATALSGAPGVTVAAPLMTANLGIEELVRYVLRDRPMRILLVCGRDSRLFRQGQSLLALACNGIRDHDHQIIGAEGHRPYLRGLRVADVEAFRSRVRVVDLRDTLDPGVLRARIAGYACRFAPAPVPDATARSLPPARFTPLRPGGRRLPIQTAGEGFFVVSVDRVRRELLLRHYRDDCVPAHEMRGHSAGSMVLGLIRAGLLREPSHAAYLGGELAKAETAVRLGLDYVQDIPLRRPPFALSHGKTVSAVESLENLTDFIGQLLGATGPELVPELPLGDQLELSSLQMIELAIALEQECGIELPDDIDLRKTSPAELFPAHAPVPDGDLTRG